MVSHVSFYTLNILLLSIANVKSVTFHSVPQCVYKPSDVITISYTSSSMETRETGSVKEGLDHKTAFLPV